ncbi:MAG: hypothetical protein CME61_06535 [Halobacteriovoraceae bacterium]|nr:hypothetical protein [Halobacteriovoraceae bacterium]
MNIFQDELKRLSADLELEYRGIKLSPIVTKSNELDQTFLNDLIFITEWLKEHSEVKYVHLDMKVDDLQSPRFTDLHKLHLFRVTLLKLQKNIQNTAATFFIEGIGAFELFWSEFLCLFDEAILHKESSVCFNHSTIGMHPILSIKNIMESLGVRKSDLIIPKKINLEKTHITVLETREVTKYLKSIKKTIFSQSELSKIQIMSSIENHEKHHSNFNANLVSEDWRNLGNFKKLRDLKEKKDQETTTIH